MSISDSKRLVFAPSQPLTLGVEIELQLLDENTLDLKPLSPQVLELYRGQPDRLKAELFQSMLEINTGICVSAHQVRSDLAQTMNEVARVCDRLGLRIATSGTHPFARYNDRVLYPADRYRDLIDRNQWIARRLMIFGLHVHVGMRSGEHAIQMNNALLHYLPLLLGLSCSSPFWHGEETELASSRITFFEAIPTGGHPCLVNSWDEFTGIYARLLKSGAIHSPKDIWWDIRPSPSFGTLEIRICDGLPTLEETVALTALIHALSMYIDRQLMGGQKFRPPPDWIMRENKWRASRHGIGARFIVNEEGDTRPFRQVAVDLLDELGALADELNYRSDFKFIYDLLDNGPSYLRQRNVMEKSGRDLFAVTNFLACEFEARSPLWDRLESTKRGA